MSVATGLILKETEERVNGNYFEENRRDLFRRG
jgi:hypothetical protein